MTDDTNPTFHVFVWKEPNGSATIIGALLSKQRGDRINVCLTYSTDSPVRDPPRD